MARRRYALRGRLRCGVCQSAMVGQTLSPKGKSYAYYRCRHAYTKSTSRACTARYIPAEALEQEIRDEVRKVLTAPEVVLRELRQPGDSDSSRGAIHRLESELATLKKREERLVQLFGYEEVDSTVVRAELGEVQRRREALSAELETLARPVSAIAADVDEAGLREVCATIAARLDGAEPEQYERVMEAVQLSVAATRDEVTVEGLLPTQQPPESTKSTNCPPECTESSAVLSPLNKHRHDDALVRRGMHQVLRRALVLKRRVETWGCGLGRTSRARPSSRRRRPRGEDPHLQLRPGPHDRPPREHHATQPLARTRRRDRAAETLRHCEGGADHG